MTLMTFTAMIILTITFILILVLNLISKKTFMDREKSSPFECGFDPKSPARLPFSLQFFMIAIIFLIFDVEITLLFPIIVTMKINSLLSYFLISSFFIIILLLGLIHEWKQGALNWSN